MTHRGVTKYVTITGEKNINALNNLYRLKREGAINADLFAIEKYFIEREAGLICDTTFDNRSITRDSLMRDLIQEKQ